MKRLEKFTDGSVRMIGDYGPSAKEVCCMALTVVGMFVAFVLASGILW